ncbi:MAG: YfhO family protein [Acidobacteria bacterium]|nr:YfhO family protein [Acidobacteriota bacterium]
MMADAPAVETVSTRTVIFSRSEWILATIALAAQAALFLAPALFTSKVVLPVDLLASYVPWVTDSPAVPQNANLSDSLQQFYPYLCFFRDQVRSGHFPLWNPYVLCGTPFLANMVSAVLFPVSWLVLLLPPETFFEWSAFLKLFLAGLGIYILARKSLHVRPLTAWCTAVAYCFCGYNIYFLGFPNTYVTMLLPWCLLTLDRGFLDADVRSRWTFSLLISALLVAGHIESAVVAILFFLLYLVILVFDLGPRWLQVSPISVRHSLMPFLFHVAWAVSLAGAVVLPFIANVTGSATFASRTQAMNPFHISLLRLPAMWIPYFFGSPVFNPKNATVGQMEQCIFLGAIPLLLAFYGISRPLNARVPAVVAGLLLSFLITFGIWPIFQLFTSLPVLKQGNHIHAVQIFQFCAVLLLALGLERWRTSVRKFQAVPLVFLLVQLGLLLWQWFLFDRFPFLHFQSRVPWYGIITLVFLFLFCATQLRPRWAPALLAGLLPGFGFLYGFYFNPVVSPDLLRQRTLLNEMNPQARFAGVGDGTALPNMCMTIPLRDFRGYESVVLLRTQRFFDRLTGKVNDPQHSIHQVDQRVAEVLKQCGIEYLISPAPLMIPGWTEVRRSGTFLYRAAERVPRALFAAAARSSTAEESLNALLAGHTEDTLFLETQSVQKTGMASGGVHAVDEMPDHLHYEVHASGPGYLLIRETYDDGWGAHVNGGAVELIRANYLFMAVALPEGESVVDVRYRPWSWIVGLILSFLSLPVVVRGMAFGGWKKLRVG